MKFSLSTSKILEKLNADVVSFSMFITVPDQNDKLLFQLKVHQAKAIKLIQQIKSQIFFIFLNQEDKLFSP